jgi:hypothetical protein
VTLALAVVLATVRLVVMVRAESPLVRPLLQCNCVRRASIAGKIAVQVDANATRDHFGGGRAKWRLVSSALTPGRQRIGSLPRSGC